MIGSRAGLNIALFAGMLAACASAQPVEPITQSKLMTSSTGWILKGDRLLFTVNLGGEWKDVSPPLESGQEFGGVFFLDPSHGWVLLHLQGMNGAELWLASTSDGGKTWSIAPFAASHKMLRENYGGGAYLIFTDAAHGWLEVRMASSSASSFGALFVTSNGGKDWTLLPSPPLCGPMGFLPGEFGWLVGGPLGDQLHITRDGGRSWTRSPVPPAVNEKPHRATFGPVKFSDSRHGTLAAWLAFEDQTTLASYVSQDGGASWKVKSLERNLRVPGDILPTAIAGGEVLRADVEDGLIILHAGGRTIAAPLPAGVAAHAGVDWLDFADLRHGWILVGGDDCHSRFQPCTGTTVLLATSDGGASYTVVDDLWDLDRKLKKINFWPFMTPRP